MMFWQLSITISTSRAWISRMIFCAFSPKLLLSFAYQLSITSIMNTSNIFNIFSQERMSTYITPSLKELRKWINRTNSLTSVLLPIPELPTKLISRLRSSISFRI
jgi:hypothetical protein